MMNKKLLSATIFIICLIFLLSACVPGAGATPTARAAALRNRPTRSPELPDTPTTSESGFPSVGYNPDVWLGLFAPGGTPTALIDQLNSVTTDMMKSPEMSAALTKLGFEAKIATPQEFRRFLAAEAQKWPPLLANAGIKGD